MNNMYKTKKAGAKPKNEEILRREEEEEKKVNVE